MNKVVAKNVSELVDVFNNIRVPLSSKQRESLAKIYPYYGAQGIVDYVDNYLFDGEYILIAEDGENLKSNNQNICNIVQGKFWVNNHAHIVRANAKNSTKYLYYNFNRIKFEPYVTGSSQPKLNKENLLNIKAYVHENLNDQKCIAKVLSDLDAKIELNNRINRELEAMAKTLYDYWFVQFDFPNEQGKPYKSTGGKMVYNSELKREIPEGWEVKKLSEIATTGSGGTPLSTNKEFYENGNIPWINSGEVNMPFIVSTKNFITQKGLENSSAKMFKRGTILMAMYGATAGKVSFMDIEACTNQAICAINPKEDFHRIYIKLVLEDLYKYLINLSSGSARDNLSQDKIRELKFVIPSKSLIQKFDEIVQSSMNKILINLKQNQQLAELRDWLLPMLMNGQVTVKEAEESLSMAAEPIVEYKKG